MPFRNRQQAGQLLGDRLASTGSIDARSVVLGLARGGVPIAAEIARALGARLDVVVVRKLGLPWEPELAMGAIAEGGFRVLNRRVIDLAGIPDGELAAVEARERAELADRAQRYRGDRPPVNLTGQVVIIADDGIATGSTARAAIAAVEDAGASRIVLATPVAAADVVRQLRSAVSELICLESPSRFAAVAQAYEDFAQTTDEDVVEFLRASSGDHRPPGREVAE